MIEMFKIGYNCYDPKVTKEIFILNNRDTRTNDSKIFSKRACLELPKHKFTIRAARELNAQLSEIINSKATNDFKNKMDNLWRKTEIKNF